MINEIKKITLLKESNIIDNYFSVILFNDSSHLFYTVVAQVYKALNCSYQDACNITTKVDRDGSAVIFIGILEQCFIIKNILEEINLKITIGIN